MVVVAAFITFIFHKSVNHRFYKLVKGMREAATARKELQFQKLEYFDHHHEEIQFRRKSHQHAQEAYETQKLLHDLFHNITVERKEISELVEDYKELRHQAIEDAEEVWEYAAQAHLEGFMSTKDRIEGTELAERATNETSDADLYMNISLVEEDEGNKRLADAQHVLDTVQDAQNVTASTAEQGVCAWIAWACTLVRGNSNLDEAKKASNLAIAAAAEMDSAMEEIEDAHRKYSLAKELYDQAAQHGNESVHMLNESRVFHNEEEEDLETAREYKAKYETEATEANNDKELAIQDEIQLIQDDKQFRQYAHQKNNLTLLARREQFKSHQLYMKMLDEEKMITDSELQIRQTILDARRHVAHASWYALLACLSAGCLFSLISVRIIVSVKSLHPFIIREDPFLFKDLTYIATHVFILLLSMGFAGDILVEYVHLNTAGRVEIVLLFAMIGTMFQCITLHLLPNIYTLKTTLSLNKDTIFKLLVEDLGKRGFAIFLVFIMEVLLCWVNFGVKAFTNAHRLNQWGMWILVGVAAIAHSICANRVPEETATATYDSYRMTGPHLVQPPRVNVEIGSVPSSHSSVYQDNPEASSLLPSSGISSLSGSSSVWFSVDLLSASRSPPATSTPQYGSMPNGQIPRRVDAAFISSWRLELRRVRILFEALIASWALWVVRRDITIIVKLAKLPSTEAWGKLPVWILFVIAISVILCVVRTYRNYTISDK